MSTEFYWVAVVLVTIVSISRITRLLVFDKFPPIARVRTAYENKVDGSDWVWLAMCGYCMAPWVALVVIGTGLWADVYDPHVVSFYPDSLGEKAWWLVTGWLAVSYLAAILMSFDGDKTEV